MGPSSFPNIPMYLLLQDPDIYDANPSTSSLMSSAFVFLTIPFSPVLGVIANRSEVRAVNGWCQPADLLFRFTISHASVSRRSYIGHVFVHGGIVLVQLRASYTLAGCSVCWHVRRTGVVDSLGPDSRSTSWHVHMACKVTHLLCLQVVSNHDTLGIAFGTIHSIENLVILVSGIGIGALRDATGGYHAALWGLTVLAAIGTCAAVALRVIGVHNRPTSCGREYVPADVVEAPAVHSSVTPHGQGAEKELLLG